MGSTLRSDLRERLQSLLARGGTALLHGPVGIGKSTMLAELARELRLAGVPVGIAPRTRGLADVTGALLRAYPDAQEPGLGPRSLRGRLRLAAAERPGVLLLDHLARSGLAMRSLLQALRETGQGVTLAADVETRRDLLALRAMRLGHVEIELPVMPARSLAEILDRFLAGKALPHPLQAGDRRLLLRHARGNPGRLLAFAALVSGSRFWRGGRIMIHLMEAAWSENVMRRRLAEAG